MMNPMEIEANIREIERKLGYTFQNKSILFLAFTHRSFVNENRDRVSEHNERLEFLGDSVLGVVISEYLYKYLPETPEGELSYLRSRIVEASSCALYANQLEIEPYILLGKGEMMNEGRGRESILADLFEAIVGAIFLDSGLDEVRKFIFQKFSSSINEILQKPLHNWKAILQDYSQKNFQKTPVYEVIEENGPDHSKSFIISVSLNDQEMGRGSGNSKKEAQQKAAEDALRKMDPNGKS